MLVINDIVHLGASLKDVRKIGRMMGSDAVNWNTADKDTQIPPGVGLATLLVRHLVEKNIFNKEDALGVVQHFSEKLCTYAQNMYDAVKDYRSGSRGTSKPIDVNVEILEGRWVRMTGGRPFDAQDYKEDAPNVSAFVWSHCVCLLPLFLQTQKLKRNDANPYGQSADLAESVV